MKVLKFGGGCLRDVELIQKLPKILKNYNNEKIIIVLSAFGKITNMLENEEFENVLDFINLIMEKLKFNSHEKKSIIQNPLSPSYLVPGLDTLSLYKLLANKLEKRIDSKKNFSYPYRVCIGEYISSSIIHYYLRKCSINSTLLDAAMCIRTNNWSNVTKSGSFHSVGIPKNNSPFYTHSFKTSNLDLDSVFLENQFLITQGFIATELVNKKNDYHFDYKNLELDYFSRQATRTTLGREGSDYSAAIFAELFGANEVILFKDVDGIYNMDPKKHSQAKLFSRLTYEEAFTFCDQGNMIVHPKTIQHLQKHNIPLSIKNFSNIDKLGTIIN